MTIDEIKKVKGSRIHKINNSYGLRDYYKYYKDNGGKLNCDIYKKVFNILMLKIGEQLLTIGEFNFHNSFGKLYLLKIKRKFNNYNNRILPNTPINWGDTLKLWCKDEEARKTKLLIRINEPYIYRVTYIRTSAKYINKSIIKFILCRTLKIKLKDKIKNNEIECFLKNTYYGKTDD